MMLNINYQIILLTLCFSTKAGEISVEPKCTATGYRLKMAAAGCGLSPTTNEIILDAEIFAAKIFGVVSS